MHSKIILNKLITYSVIDLFGNTEAILNSIVQEAIIMVCTAVYLPLSIP